VNFDGFDYGKYDYNSTGVTKKPIITNTGDVPVYAFIGLELYAEDSSGVKIQITTADRDAILSGVDFDVASWFGITPIPNTTTKGWTGGFFYQIPSGIPCQNDNLGLATIAKGASTSNLFTKVDLSKNLSNDLSGAVLKLELTGYAVQSSGNPYPNAGGDSSLTQGKAFDGLLVDDYTNSWIF
jgi:hypothetical protein